MPQSGLSQGEKDEIYRRRKDRLPRIVSDGDSWFAYPIHASLIDWLSSHNGFAIKRCEHSGDTLQTIVGTGRYVQWLASEHPKCLLISGGGNDLGQEPWIQQLFRAPDGSHDPRQMIDSALWKQRLQHYRSEFEELVGSVVQPVPILVHGYDYFIPSNVPVRIDGFPIMGPWIYPAMKAVHIDDPANQRSAAKALVDDFNDMLIELAATHASLWHCDLRGTLSPSDWANEIHPTEAGFGKLTDKYNSYLLRLLQGNVAKGGPV